MIKWRNVGKNVKSNYYKVISPFYRFDHYEEYWDNYEDFYERQKYKKIKEETECLNNGSQ